MDLASLLVSLVVLGALVAIVAWKRGGPGVGEALFRTRDLVLRGAPSLALGFLIAGFLLVLVPEALVGTWMGEESGMKGLLVGTLAGVVTPGGPFAHFPVLASLAQKGAGVGPLTAYIAAWSLLGLHRTLLWEAPFLGWRFVGVRILACLFFPPLMGALARAISLGLGARESILHRM